MYILHMCISNSIASHAYAHWSSPVYTWGARHHGISAQLGMCVVWSSWPSSLSSPEFFPHFPSSGFPSYLLLSYPYIAKSSLQKQAISSCTFIHLVAKLFMWKVLCRWLFPEKRFAQLDFLAVFSLRNYLIYVDFSIPRSWSDRTQSSWAVPVPGSIISILSRADDCVLWE